MGICCSQVLAMMNKDAVNIRVYVFAWTYVFISLGQIHGGDFWVVLYVSLGLTL